MFYSVVVPVKDESESLPLFYKELKNSLESLRLKYEIVFVDDGSIDRSYEILNKLKKNDVNVKIIKFRANFGKSKALAEGFKLAKGDILITLDADLQDDPAEISKLLSEQDKGYDIVCGWRYNRRDGVTKKISSFLFNKGTAFLSGVRLHDFNCGLKVLKKEVANELYLYGELHRFIPVLAAKRKFRVSEVKTNHRSRRFGISKYGKFGIARSWKGIVDLLTSIFLSDYAHKPAHFFGKIGLPLFVVGLLLDSYVTYIKVTTGTTQGKTPLLLAGVLFMVLGLQLLATGLIAEMITYYYHRVNDHQ